MLRRGRGIRRPGDEKRVQLADGHGHGSVPCRWGREGAETEVDRVVVDSLYDPLVHMLRNALDHKPGGDAGGHVD